MNRVISRSEHLHLFDPLLGTFAEAFTDLEQTRIAAEHRLFQLTNTEPDKDGVRRGLGLSANDPQVLASARQIKHLKHDAGILGRLGYDTKTLKPKPCPCLECAAERDLVEVFKRHALYEFVSTTRGIGLKTGARLLATIGDPYWNTAEDRPRRLSDLFAYTGYHVVKLPGNVGVAPTRVRGQHANWSSPARVRAWLVAESCMKRFCESCKTLQQTEPGKHADDCECSPYRLVYEQRRAVDEGAVHKAPCVRCGPSGRPAETGSPLSPKHQDHRARRAVAKAVLEDLWKLARDIHVADRGA